MIGLMADASKPAMQMCARCILSDGFPNLTFDADGVCNFCQKSPPPADLERHRAELKARMEDTIASKRGTGSYDCVVAFSGGKDSSYTLLKLVRDYELRCLAVTVDNGFISPQAVKNCYAVTSALGVDFQLFTPATAMMNRIYLASAQHDDIHTPAAITRASSMCNSCINLINNYMIKLAVQGDIPIIAGGYIGGQVPKNGAILDIDLVVQKKTRGISLQRYVARFGESSRPYFDLPDSLVERSRDKKITILNPMLALIVSEEKIIEEISRLGWVRTMDTGLNSSNCLLNDLGIYVHHKQHGFHPYAFEISEQVRAGLMSRDEAIKRVTTIPERDDVRWQATKIGLDV
jgi:tRNA(Ile)-lysidine synthase TilS/MesJ